MEMERFDCPVCGARNASDSSLCKRGFEPVLRRDGACRSFYERKTYSHIDSESKKASAMAIGSALG